MDIIPVIDLKDGHVVLARGGARHLYAPIETPLAPTSRPHDVIAGFLSLYPFRKIYIADLDAITGAGGHASIVAALESYFPDLEFWVDTGLATESRATAWLAQNRGALIIGSENLGDLHTAPRLAAEPRRILSLDFRGDDFLGPPALATNPEFWPRRVIVMTLAKVGAGSGPDFARLDQIHTHAPTRDLYAAGGVRDAEDLRRLEAAGIAGVLVASALHNGKITATDLRDANAHKKGEPKLPFDRT
jgi:HisA/HisF family protein